MRRGWYTRSLTSRTDLARAAISLALATVLSGLILAGCMGPAPDAASPTPPGVPIAATPTPQPTVEAPREAALGEPSAAASPSQTPTAAPTATAAAPPTPIATASRTPAPAAPTPEPTVQAATSTPAPTVPAAPSTPARSSPSATATPAATATPRPALSTETFRQAGADLAGLELSGAAFDRGRVVLAQAGEKHVASGQATSPVHATGFPFNTAILSWNADAPPGTSLKLDLRVRMGEEWSGWYTMGTWAAGGGASVAGQADRWGSVDVDTLRLTAPASAFQYRVSLATTNPSATPALRLVAVAYSDLSRAPVGPEPAGGPARGKDLDVPRLSQLDQAPDLAWLVCSPTSLTMVLRYWGLDQTVPETIRGVRDAANGIYGNWPLNTAFAGARGLQAYVDRFYSIAQLEAEVAAGRPVIASVRWRAGELDNASVPSALSGHLIVVRGFTPQGDVIVNDPAARGEGVRRVYKREQFGKIWLGEGGVVYLVRPS